MIGKVVYVFLAPYLLGTNLAVYFLDQKSIITNASFYLLLKQYTILCLQGLQESSVQLHSIVIPVIRLSTDTTQDAHIYLLEDGLNLWKVVLYYCKEATPDILNLFSAMPALLGMFVLSCIQSQLDHFLLRIA